MGWAARKLAMSDYIDQEQVIKEYFDKKEQKLLQEKLLAEFWKEYEDERGA
jgi:negative regulator of sigma E activity